MTDQNQVWQAEDYLGNYVIQLTRLLYSAEGKALPKEDRKLLEMIRSSFVLRQQLVSPENTSDILSEAAWVRRVRDEMDAYDREKEA